MLQLMVGNMDVKQMGKCFDAILLNIRKSPLKIVTQLLKFDFNTHICENTNCALAWHGSFSKKVSYFGICSVSIYDFISYVLIAKKTLLNAKKSKFEQAPKQSLKFYLSHFWSPEVKLLYAFMCLKYNLMRYLALLSKTHHLENCKSFCCDFQNKNRCLKTKEKWTYWNHKECMTWVYKFTWAECSRLAKVSQTTLCLFQVNLFDA